MNEWKPNPGQQEEALRRIEDEIGFGGARGGGKTESSIVKGTDILDFPGARGLVIRKSLKDLSDWVNRAKWMYKRYGAVVTGANYEPHIVFPNRNVEIVGGYLKDASSYERYQGHEYQLMLIEELTQIPTEEMYLMLLGSNRSTIPGLKAQVFCTFNPGGVGHVWVKKRFIDPAPANTTMLYKFTFDNPITGSKEVVTKSRVFIPSKIEDNPALIEKDPSYVAYLESLKSTNPDLYEAWRHGNWDVFAGQFFKTFRRDTHVVRIPQKVRVSETLRHVGGMDWGYNANFVFLASVVQRVKLLDGRSFNRVWTYKEFVGREKSPKEWARIIHDPARDKNPIDLNLFSDIYADPAMFNRETSGGNPIADQMAEVWTQNGNKLKRASNDRVGGWARMHDWLSIAPDGLPYWMIDESCSYLIETLPAQVHDDHNVEDINTDGEDHAVDTARYHLYHIDWIDASVGAVGSKPDIFKNVAPAFMDRMDLKAFETAGNKSMKKKGRL